MSNERKPGYLLYIGDYTTVPNYVGTIIYNDPYEPIRIQWNVIYVFFFRTAPETLPPSNHQVSPRTKAQPAECKLQCGRWASESEGSFGLSLTDLVAGLKHWSNTCGTCAKGLKIIETQ